MNTVRMAQMVLGWIVLQVGGLLSQEVLFEQFEQFSGFDICDMSLRVRKFNRTMSTLNGTIYIRQPMGDNLKLYTDLFHSRLGNQQFNHYPAKLPTAGFCEFIRNLHAGYGKHLEDIVNVPQPDECPIKAREVYILDKVFPSSTIPPVFPTGLWKMVITGRVDEEDKLRYQMVLHVHEKDFFG